MSAFCAIRDRQQKWLRLCIFHLSLPFLGGKEGGLALMDRGNEGAELVLGSEHSGGI